MIDDSRHGERVFDQYGHDRALQRRHDWRPIKLIEDAEAWYVNLFGPDVEILHPVPGVVEFKAAPGVWYQIFEAEEQQASGTIVRFLVDDIEETQRAGTEVGINMGEAIAIPEVVTFSEFSDPDGNALGLYDLP